MQKDILRILVLNNHFCTISTSSHLYKSFALADSLAVFNDRLHILLVDNKETQPTIPENVQIHQLNELNNPLAKQIISKYKDKTNCLRWSIKSVFLIHLLQAYTQMIYVDNDILFYADPNFLFKYLEDHNILLTPHHYPRDPERNQQWLEANFKVGIFNAGFIGVNKQAVDTMIWWAKACLYRCEKNNWRGLFDDQKYLDLVLVIEPTSKIINHKGCNVAEWNREICVKTEGPEGVIINDEFPLVFYHFNNFSLTHLPPNGYLITSYLKALQKHRASITYKDLVQGTPLIDRFKLFVWKILNKLNG